MLQFVDADITTTGDNPYGGVSEAISRLDATVVPMLVHRQLDRCDPLHAFYFDLEYNSVKIGAGRIEMRHTEFPSGKINCLQVGPQFDGLDMREDSWSGLLLEETEGRFRRVGVFFLLEDYVDFFDGFEPRLIELI